MIRTHSSKLLICFVCVSTLYVSVQNRSFSHQLHNLITHTHILWKKLLWDSSLFSFPSRQRKVLPLVGDVGLLFVALSWRVA